MLVHSEPLEPVILNQTLITITMQTIHRLICTIFILGTFFCLQAEPLNFRYSNWTAVNFLKFFYKKSELILVVHPQRIAYVTGFQLLSGIIQ